MPSVHKQIHIRTNRLLYGIKNATLCLSLSVCASLILQFFFNLTTIETKVDVWQNENLWQNMEVTMTTTSTSDLKPKMQVYSWCGDILLERKNKETTTKPKNTISKPIYVGFWIVLKQCHFVSWLIDCGSHSVQRIKSFVLMCARTRAILSTYWTVNHMVLLVLILFGFNYFCCCCYSSIFVIFNHFRI